MLKKMSDDERYSGLKQPVPQKSAVSWLKELVRGKASNSNQQIQEALEDFIEDLKETDLDNDSVDNQKELISNVLKTQELRVSDVMIPRANIISISENASLEDIKALFREKQFSRLPVYRDTLDNIVGTIHIKDILLGILEDRPLSITDIMREPMIVSPGMPVMDLFVAMREDKKHMALVVDEHGGIDGVVTLNDVIEAILGDVKDEFDHEDQPTLIEKPDGSVIVDARMEVEEFEERFGGFLNAQEREEVDTLGGLTYELAGRIPKRGEIFEHVSGVTIEVLDADTRKINRLRMRNLPSKHTNDEV